MRRNLLVYGLSVVLFGAGIGLALLRGGRLESTGAAAEGVRAAERSPAAARPAATGVRERLREPLPLLLLQLIVIVCAARLCGTAIQRFGQPAVIGEIVAGIALGPSLLGAIAPGILGLTNACARSLSKEKVVFQMAASHWLRSLIGGKIIGWRATKWNRASRCRLCRPTLSTWTLWSPSSWTFPGLARGNMSWTRK